MVNGNDLSGTIPAYVGSYPGMGEAWLPRNNLSGPLDPSLCQGSGSGDNIHLQAGSSHMGSHKCLPCLHPPSYSDAYTSCGNLGMRSSSASGVLCMM